MKSLKIAILGTRGIPNNYGGFEYAAERLSTALAFRGHDITVYNSHNHLYKRDIYDGVHIIHCYDPESKIGTAGQFVYDLNCLLDARKRNFDIILMFGYTSNAIWGRLYPPKSIIITNMDGLEWKREKYSRPIRVYLKHAEKLAVRFSDFHIADSLAIQKYLAAKYNIEPAYIPYGADLYGHDEKISGGEYPRNNGNGFLLMARMEPENNVETILTGFHQSYSRKKFTVIGDIQNRFGKYLTNKFKNDLRIEFSGAVFDKQKVNNYLAQAYIYFHGHSVGGTNPSLLQAMANKTLIASHSNPFNAAILENDALYFSNANDVQFIIDNTQIGEKEETMIRNNLKKIQHEFNWNAIADRYEGFIMECYNKMKL